MSPAAILSFAHHILHRIDSRFALPALLVIHRLHTPGNIDDQHDVDALGLDLALATAQLWPGQRDDEQHQRRPTQQQQQRWAERRPKRRQRARRRHRGEFQAAALRRPSFPPQPQRQHEQQDQRPWTGELHTVATVSSARGCESCTNFSAASNARGMSSAPGRNLANLTRSASCKNAPSNSRCSAESE